MNFKIDSKIFDQFNDLHVAVIVCNNINNTVYHQDIKPLFIKTCEQTRNKLSPLIDDLSSYPIIAKWRDVYRSFGAKKARCSVESLIRRIVNGHTLPNINPIVDLYNIVSLTYELPCGGEDLKSITHDVELAYAVGDEQFISLGSDIVETVEQNEIVYKFDKTVICRNFNYRESDLTKLTSDTTSCILVIEGFSAQLDNINKASESLSNYVKKYCNADCHIHLLNKNHCNIKIN